MKSQHELVKAWLDPVKRARKPRRKASSMFFEGDTIYSHGHHWPIARITTLPDGREVVLLHSVPHTSSTNRHTRVVANAVPYKSSFNVHHDLFSSVTDELSMAEAMTITKEMERQRLDEERKRRNERACSAREWRGDMAIQELERLLDVELEGEMSRSSAVRIELALRDRNTPGRSHNTYGHTRYRWNQGKLPELGDPLVGFLRTVVAEDPSIIKRPKALLEWIEKYELLVS
jgi:hypothetical protein